MALVPAPLLAGVLIAAVLAYAAYRAVCATPLRLAAFYRSRGVRGSPFVPVVGDMPRLRAARARGGEWLHTFLADEIAAHGTVSYLFLGPEFRLRVADPGLARGVLLTHADAFVKPSLLRRMLGPLLGEGLLLAEGEVWRRHRRLMNPAFSHARLAAMVPLMGAAASSVVDRWLARGSGGAGSGGGVAVDMHHDLAAATLAIIGAAAFGMDLDAAEADGVYDALNALLGASQSNVFMLTAFIPGYASLPTPANRAMKRHIGHLRALLSAVIANRRALRADPATSPAPGDQILLDALLDAHDEAAAPADAPAGDAASTAPPLPAAAAVARPPGAGLTDGELFDEAMTMVVAGHETTSQALCWTLLLLARHPEWQARVRAQVCSVLGDRTVPTAADLAAMPLLQAVLWEAMRLYPPAPVVVRTAARDVTMDDGFTVAAGTTVTIVIAAIHRLESLWRDPDTFDPTRWADGLSGALPHPYAFLPFSHGPRNCIGAVFAQQEARVILAVMLRRLSVALAPSYIHAPEMTITLRPKYGMPMIVTPVP